MHELAICSSVLEQVLSVAHARGATRVSGITLRIGPLAGVEPALLRAAFPLVATGTGCENAIFEIETLPVQIHCAGCDMTYAVPANRLLCPDCGAWRVRLVSGDEMQLGKVDLMDAAHV